ncbi:putative ubiquitin-conjugating enzyme E2 38 [Diplonema papillatum]|nr:putative ubiquitin-conjugating enzyme E2 38 [Diplonema papillatum]
MTHPDGGNVTHKMYDIGGDPRDMSTSIATHAFQIKIQNQDIVRLSDAYPEADGYVGLVISVAGQDDDESEDVQDGMASVWIMDQDRPSGRRAAGTVVTCDIADLEVVDRMFMRSDEVAPYPETQSSAARGVDGKTAALKQGRVADVDVKMKVQLLDSGTEVWVHSTQFTRLHAFSNTHVTALLAPELLDKGVAFCTLNSMRLDLIFKFADGAYCCVPDASNNQHILNAVEAASGRFPYCENSSMIYYLNQPVTCPLAFQHYGMYLKGKWKRTHRKGTVVSIVPYELAVAVVAMMEEAMELWAERTAEEKEDDAEVASESGVPADEDAADEATGDGSQAAESEEDEPQGAEKNDEKNDTASDSSAHHDRCSYGSRHDSTDYNGEAGNFVVHPSLVHSVTAPDSHQLVNFGSVGMIDADVFAKIHQDAKQQSKKKPGPADKETGDAADAEDVVDETYIKENPTPLAPPRFFAPLEGPGVATGDKLDRRKKRSLAKKRMGHYASAIRNPAARQQIELARKRAAVVTALHTRVKVQWQDGTLSDWISSKDLYTLHHTQDFEFFPGDVVAPASQNFMDTLRTSTDLPRTPTTFTAPSLQPPRQAAADEMKFTAVRDMTCSCYDISDKLDQWKFAYADFVLYCPRSPSLVRKVEAALAENHEPAAVEAAPGGGEAERAGGEEGGAEDGGGGEKRETKPSGGCGWACEDCTLINDDRARRCDVCGAPRPWARPRLAKGREDGEQMMVVFGPCAELLPPVPLTPADDCLGVIRSVNAKERVARVDWVLADASPTSQAVSIVANGVQFPGVHTSNGLVVASTTGVTPELLAQAGLVSGCTTPITVEFRPPPTPATPPPHPTHTHEPYAREMFPTYSATGIQIGITVGIQAEGIRVRWHRHAIPPALLALHGQKEEADAPKKRGKRGKAGKPPPKPDADPLEASAGLSAAEEIVPFSDVIVPFTDREEVDSMSNYSESEPEDAGEAADDGPPEPSPAQADPTSQWWTWGRDFVKGIFSSKKQPNSHGNPADPPAAADDASSAASEDGPHAPQPSAPSGRQPGADEADGSAGEDDDDENDRFTVIPEFTDHAYINEPIPQLDIKRVQKEWSTFHKNLPAGIKVIASETQPHLLQALIEGPAFTPYRNSLYFFQLLLPAQFPKMPPKAQISSYGLRLNPNLYADGHICLSLIGTWTGYDECERWGPQSTLLQVFISIQALVLTKEPYYNEAGYHNHLGTDEGRHNSKAYNEQTYLLSLRYLTSLLQHPPKHAELEILRFVKRNWEGTLKRADEYLKNVDEEKTSEDAAPAVPAQQDLKQTDADGAKQDKRIITAEELQNMSSLSLVEDGLVLPVSYGFAVSLRTSVLPQLKRALVARGFRNE